MWDADAGELARDIPDGQGGLLDPSVFPCRVETIQSWLDSSRPITPVDEMGNLTLATRVGFAGTVGSRQDDAPHPARFGAGLTCDLDDPCPDFGSLDLGGLCGSCEAHDSQPNPHQGQDAASYTKLVTASFDEGTERQSVHEYRTWRSSHPTLQNARGQSPHHASSVQCTWGAYTDYVLVSREYTASKDVYFDTDFINNSLLFREDVTDRIAFPGIGHRGEFEWTDTTIASRPIVEQPDSQAQEWTWDDRMATVGGFGVRTPRTWCYAYVLINRTWQMRPYEDPPVKTPADDFEVVVAAGAGGTANHPVDSSPFGLPTDNTLEAALKSLVRAAFNDVNWGSQLHSESLFTWEVRA